MSKLMRAACAFAVVVGNLVFVAPAWCDVTATMQFMREEEKLARDVYATLYTTWGNQVFDNIAYSEQSHTDAMKRLLDKYGVEDPVALTGVDPGIYPDSCTGTDSGTGCVFYNSVLGALYLMLVEDGSESAFAGLLVGGLIEEKDMIDIQAAIDETDDGHIQSVYDRLKCGSENHLRAFARNIELLSGTSYLEASEDYIREVEHELSVVLRTKSSEEAINAILSSPMSKCGP